MEYYKIAEIQLLKAINLFEEEDYICAITLAGAAEEILGKLVKYIKGKEVHNVIDLYTIETSKLGISKKETIDTLNSARNILKHFKENDECNFKPVDDSVILILRAIVNYNIYRDGVLPEMIGFYKSDKVQQTLKHMSEA